MKNFRNEITNADRTLGATRFKLSRRRQIFAFTGLAGILMIAFISLVFSTGRAHSASWALTDLDPEATPSPLPRNIFGPGDAVISTDITTDDIFESVAEAGVAPLGACAATITQSSSFTVTSGQTVACITEGQPYNHPASYWRAFTMSAFGVGVNEAYNVTSVVFGIEAAEAGAGNTHSITVRLYAKTGAAFPSGYPNVGTQIATQTIQISDQSGLITVPLVTVVPAGTSQLIMEVFTPSGFAQTQILYMGGNADPETGPGYIGAPACNGGSAVPRTTAAVGFPGAHYVMAVNGTGCTTVTPSPTPTVTPTPVPSPTATPVSFVVTNTNDGGPGSLRQAVLDANAAVGLNTISFNSLFNTAQTITLTTGNIVFTNSANSNANVIGPGSSLLTVSGNNTGKIFSILETPVVSITGMRLTQGNGVGISPGDGFGGAIYNQGALTVTDLIVTGNRALIDGGGIYNSTSDSLTVNNCTISNNIADFDNTGTAAGGGGLYSTTDGVLMVTNTMVTGNSVGANANNGGGGIAVFGPTTITGSTISGNTSGRGGGGIFNAASGDTLTISGSVISNNIARFGSIVQSTRGGGLESNNTANGTTNITNSTFIGNSFGNANLAVSPSRDGGGIFSQFGTFNMTGSTVSGNSGGAGGGIHVIAGTNTISNSTFSGNSASGSNTSSGGGLYLSGTNTLTNLTISGNMTTAEGGGIYEIGGGPITLTSLTIVDNTAGAQGGGIQTDGTISLRNTIVANNINPAAPDIGGSPPVNSLGYNLIKSPIGPAITGDTTTNITGQDPNLGPLQSNGGLNFTHALLPGSPAIDKGLAFGLPTDQRLQTRPVNNPNVANATGGDGADIGAFEIQPSLQFDPVAYTVVESVGTATITVTRLNGSDGVDTVQYNTANGTGTGGTACTDGVDFINTSGILTFTAGILSQTLNVTICDDNVFESSETVGVALSLADGASVSGMNPIVLTITDNDPLVTISGRVTTPAGLSLRNAIVSLTDSQGVRRTATTSSFGVYSFTNVPGGQNYTLGVSSKRYRFAVRFFTVNSDLADVNFEGLE